MGNRSSTASQGTGPTVSQSDDGQSVTVNGTEGETVVTESGVFLSNELQADILGAFQSQVLQTQWEKLQTKIMVNHNERISQNELRKLQVEEEVARWKKDNDEVQNILDERMEGVKSQFWDLEVALQQDVQNLENKVGNVPKFGGDTACFDVRSSLTSCYKNTKDVRTCDELVAAMDRCVKQTVIA
eukprot:CAMPEP_0197245702 /NCGR_PEP_ID=MMETSP1429-20130617/10409_1 /TAXON_ID=49237 /ORGANISM="Chaetoceros  sp., Strain UNC1202" /LENGTH=185 /DNA_ID=CAMNT_0042706245 /DNA_START=38 /DNA_END=595 /DNA_ORIENTATION=-